MVLPSETFLKIHIIIIINIIILKFIIINKIKMSDHFITFGWF